MTTLPNSGVFVTGTGTDIGKTWVSAWLVRSWQADYWKPVQTGTRDGCDADVIAGVAPEARIHESRHAYPDPLSPHAAAARAGGAIALADFVLPTVSGRRLVVEGAGGILVPLNGEHLMVDLMIRLRLPVLIVASSALGTINHTLLSVEALRARGIEPAGVVLNGEANADNRAAIERFSRVAVVAELPRLDSLGALRNLPAIPWRLPGESG